MGSFSGKTAVVTGASSGIGRAVALRLGEAGAHVFAAGRRADALAGTINPVPFKSQNQTCQDFLTYFNYDGSAAASCSRSKACALNNMTADAYGQCDR